MFWYIVMRDKATKEVIGQFSAPDHPAMLMGKDPKDYPHPWVNEFDPAKHEMVYMNPDDAMLDEIRLLRANGNRSVLEVITEEYNLDETTSPDWPTEEIVLGLAPDWGSKKLGDPVGVKKGVVPRPDGAKTATLKKKI